MLDGIETAIMAVLRKASQAYDVTDEFDTFVTLHGEQQGAHAPWDRQSTIRTASRCALPRGWTCDAEWPLERAVMQHRLTSHCPVSSGKQLKLNVHAFPMPFVNIPEPVTLEVRGEGRVRPEIKHTQVSVALDLAFQIRDKPGRLQCFDMPMIAEEIVVVDVNTFCAIACTRGAGHKEVRHI